MDWFSLVVCVLLIVALSVVSQLLFKAWVAFRWKERWSDPADKTAKMRPSKRMVALLGPLSRLARRQRAKRWLIQALVLFLVTVLMAALLGL